MEEGDASLRIGGFKDANLAMLEAAKHFRQQLVKCIY
jgi:hypothetical protein